MKQYRKYLMADSLEWLLDPEDPVIRYLALRDILGRASDHDYRSLMSAVPVASLLKKVKNNILGDTKRFGLYHRGSLWFLALAAEFGLDQRTDCVRETALFLLEKAQLESGGITLPWKPPVESALYTGELARILIRTGIVDHGVPGAVEWLCDHQRYDGGWLYWPVGGALDMLGFMLFNRPGRGGARDDDREIPSCPYASLACARALMLYLPHDTLGMIKTAIQKAAGFFLSRRLFQFDNRPLYNSRLIPRQDFTRLGYPVLGQYDVLSACIFIAQAGRFDDYRAADTFNSIMSKQDEKGRWSQESHLQGMIRYATASGAKEESKWVTLNVMRLLKHIGE